MLLEPVEQLDVATVGRLIEHILAAGGDLHVPAAGSGEQAGLDKMGERPLDAAVEPAAATGQALGELVASGLEDRDAVVAEIAPGIDGAVGGGGEDRQHRVLKVRDGHFRPPHSRSRR